MRQRVRQILASAHLDPISVENGAHPGTPDLNFTHGWLELKRADAWPIRSTTPFRLEHFTPQQRVWLARRARVGACWLLLRVGKTPAWDWLLLRGDRAAKDLGSMGEAQLKRTATGVWYPALNAEELVGHLTQPWIC